MINFFKTNDIPYIKWDSDKKDFIDATVEKSASGLDVGRKL